MASSGTSASLRQYGTRPYESDGGFSVQGLLLTTAVGMAVAAILGVAVGVVGQLFYAVLIFPIAIGLGVGAAQIWAIREAKIRSPIACGAAGLVAGVVAVVTMHFFNYLVFQREMNEAALVEQSLRLAIAEETDAEEREYLKAALAEYEADPEVLDVKGATSFMSYLDWSARQGVEISPVHSVSKGLNLGYTGTYVYWATEAVIVALCAAAVARRRAAAPFCVKCDTWKVERELGCLNAPPKVVAEAIQSGRLADLPAIAGTSNHEVAICVCECPGCPDEDEVVLQVDQVTYNHGTRSKSPAARAIYPRAAASDLMRLFGEGAAENPQPRELATTRG
jgi:hypothetical protein